MVANDREEGLVVGENHGIVAVGVLLVVGPWVLGDSIDQGLEEGGRQRAGDVLRHKDFEALRGFGGETGTGAGVAVGVRDVWFDVEDGGAVDEVGAGDEEHGAWVDTQQAYGGEANGIGAEGASSGEDAHPTVATEARGAHGCFEC